MKKVQIKGRKVLAIEAKVVNTEILIDGVYLPVAGDTKDSMIVDLIEIGADCFKITDKGRWVLPRYGNDSYMINGETHYLINEDDLAIQII